MTDQIKLVGVVNPDGKTFNEDGGTYPNMFDAHPPFQIDGNFGFTSGLTEMLVQSHDGTIHILPALPDNWPTGRVAGLRARGGFIIDELEWKDGQVTKLKIISTLGGNCRIRSYWPLHAESASQFAEASGQNQNPFYQLPEIKQPLISAKANTDQLNLKSDYLYDLATKPGQKIMLIQK